MIRSMRSKVFLAIISITLLTASAITLVFYLKSTQMIEDNYGQNLYGRIEQVGNAFDDAMKEIYYITVQASDDGQLAARTENYSLTKDVASLEKISSDLGRFKKRYSDIGSVYLVIPGQKTIVTSEDYPIYEKKVRDSVLQGVENVSRQDHPVIIDDPIRNQKKILSFIEPLKSDGGKTIAYVMCNIEERAIYYKYLDILNDGKSSEAVLLNKENAVVSTKNAESMGKIYKNSSFPNVQQNGIFNKRKPAVMGISYKTVFTGCSFFITVEKSVVLRDLNQLKYFLLAFLFLFLGISLIPAYFATRAMYEPLRNLTAAMDEVSAGELDKRVKVYTNDEIGRLSNDFNNMLNQIEKLIERLVKEEGLKKDAELEALQYQITPHFMYNTLNSIKFAALLKGEKELGNLIGDFVELLQASVNKKGTFVTVSDELHILNNYIHLQKIRYDGHFEVDYQIDEKAGSCFVPRLILQPLVENSILHGLDMKKDNSRIEIKAMIEEDYLCISVKDNGRGMTQEQIYDLLTKKTKKTNGLSGIGVANVRERLVLYYGNNAGLGYDSNSDGTTAYLYLPAYKEQNLYAV
ncbi:sensor histidine kinase [Anaerostipes sp.]|uniref:sensor histidine kinase n=1 Tax=Anaerostipes sp. TaxID=1872530 RepID=UPI0025C1D23D|nr:sensor histidine kinase [Anaerostipes sp.]MBS7006905.1 sensor histidine kinase [Anaerostipes sp.]